MNTMLPSVKAGARITPNAGSESSKYMIFIVFADLHLDAAFEWANPATASRRRQALRDTLERVLAVADEVDADAILCAGDLYEQDRFTPDTREFVKGVFGRTHRKIVITPGNHDWLGPHSLYAQTEWSSNVLVFEEDSLTPLELDQGLTLWGAAFTRPTRSTGFLQDGFAVDRGGVHLALFHGSESRGLPYEAEGKAAYAPFVSADIKRAGLCHAFVGHHHTPRGDVLHTYPGNPDPLRFGETGERGVVIARVDPDGVVRLERRVVAVSCVHDLELDVTGCNSFQDIRDRATQHLNGLSGVARLTLQGELAPDVELNLQTLQEVPNELDDLVIRRSRLRLGYDLDSIAEENTIRGRFVCDVRAADDMNEEERRQVLATGLRALDGRDDLEVF